MSSGIRGLPSGSGTAVGDSGTAGSELDVALRLIPVVSLKTKVHARTIRISLRMGGDHKVQGRALSAMRGPRSLQFCGIVSVGCWVVRGSALLFLNSPPPATQVRFSRYLRTYTFLQGIKVAERGTVRVPSCVLYLLHGTCTVMKTSFDE